MTIAALAVAFFITALALFVRRLRRRLDLQRAACARPRQTSRPFQLLRWPATSWSWRSVAGASSEAVMSNGGASGRLSCCRSPLRCSAAISPCRRGCSSDCLRLPLAISGLLMLWQPLWRREPDRAIGPSSRAARSSKRRCARPSGGHHRDRWRNLSLAAAASAALGDSKAIAGTCAAFILVNSISGLIGQLLKSGAGATFAIFHGGLAAVSGGCCSAASLDRRWVVLSLITTSCGS